MSSPLVCSDGNGAEGGAVMNEGVGCMGLMLMSSTARRGSGFVAISLTETASGPQDDEASRT
eukprot:753136-Hanusia_phi.AAC.4